MPRGVILALSGAPEPERRTLARCPGPLVPLANRPLLHHAVAALRDAGIREVAIVADRLGPVLRAALDAGEPWDMHFAHVIAPAGGELAALAPLAEFLAGRPAVLHRAEGLLGGGLAAELRGLARGGAAARVLTRTPHPGDAASVPARGRLGIELLAPGTLERVVQAAGAREGGLSVTAGLGRLEAGGARVEHRPVPGSWTLGASTEDVLEGHRFALDAIEPAWDPGALRDSRIEGRVVIDPSSEIERSLVRGPVVIGPGVRVSDAYIGPYTALGAGTCVENAEIEHSLVLREVVISDVGWRLERSIVGDRARITRSFRLPRAVSVCVGDDADISVS